MGVKHDLFMVEVPDEHVALWECFASKPMFMQIINALLELDHGTCLRDQKHAQHNAVNYQIQEGKLWFIGGGTKIWARP
jgi:hypothetical protein